MDEPDEMTSLQGVLLTILVMTVISDDECCYISADDSLRCYVGADDAGCCSVGSDLQQAFERVDHDGDGVINVEQLEQIALSLGLKLSHSQAEAVVLRFGSKGQSCIGVSCA